MKTGTVQGRRRLLAAAVVVLGLLAAAPSAQAVEIGISDSNSSTVTDGFWPGLGVNRIRVVLPYDVATTRGDAGTRRRDDFEALRTQAYARGVQLFVVFGPSADVRAPDTGYPLAPSIDEFVAGFSAFRARYPEITTLGAWNEPNNPEATQYPISWNPQLAADYWLRANEICFGQCTVVAGEFAGIVNDDWFVDAYLSRLGSVVPAVFSFHAHADINSFQANGPDDARVTRYYLGKLQGPWAGSRLWIDEVGARFRDASGFVWGDDSQVLATQFLLGLATLDPRIDLIYYYNYANECAEARRCAVQDRGLVAPAPWSGESPGYDSFRRQRPAFQVIAQRGPVIPPAQSIPPVVRIDVPAQAAAVNTSQPTFSGQAAVGGRAANQVTLTIFPGAGATQGSTPVQTVPTPLVAGRWSVRLPAPLPDGTYTAQAAQVGNRSSSGVSEDVVFTVDTVAPTSTLSGGPRGSVTGSRVATFRFESSEPASTFVCSIDGARAVPCTSPLTLRDMQLGRRSLGIRAIDAAGNVQRTPSRKSWTVVSLAAALAPRTADLATTLENGLPLAASCADACRVGARLYMTAESASAAGLRGRRVSRRDPARPRGRGYVVVGGASVERRRAGTSTLALRLRGGSSASSARSVTVRLGFVLRAKRSKPVVVSRRVTLARGSLRSLAADGLPVTVVCSSACSQQTQLWVTNAVATRIRAPGRAVRGGGGTGLPSGGAYVSLGTASVTAGRGGAKDVTIAVPRAVHRRLPRLASAGLRIAGRASGPGSPARTLGWPLVLTR